jgi:hypothetical protein
MSQEMGGVRKCDESGNGSRGWVGDAVVPISPGAKYALRLNGVSVACCFKPAGVVVGHIGSTLPCYTATVNTEARKSETPTCRCEMTMSARV